MRLRRYFQIQGFLGNKRESDGSGNTIGMVSHVGRGFNLDEIQISAVLTCKEDLQDLAKQLLIMEPCFGPIKH